MAAAQRTIRRSYNAQARTLLLQRYPRESLAQAVRLDLERAVKVATGKDMAELADVVVWREDDRIETCVSW